MDPYTSQKVNAKENENLNVTPETIKLLEEMRKKLLDLELNNDSLDRIQKTKATKGQINLWHHIITKKLLHSKEKHEQNEKATSIMGKKCIPYIR